MNYEFEVKGDIFNEIKIKASLLDYWLNVIIPELKFNFNNELNSEPLKEKFLIKNINLPLSTGLQVRWILIFIL